MISLSTYLGNRSRTKTNSVVLRKGKSGDGRNTGQEGREPHNFRKPVSSSSLLFVNVPGLFRNGLVRVCRRWQYRTIDSLFANLEYSQIVEDAAHYSLTISEGFRILKQYILHVMSSISMSMQGITMPVTSLASMAAVQINEMWYVKLLGRMVLYKQ